MTVKKPIIKSIVMDEKTKQKLDDILKSNLSNIRKQWKQKHMVGECNRCRQIPTKMIIYDKENAQLIERYCDKCFPGVK